MPNASALERDENQTMLVKPALWTGRQSLNFGEMNVGHKWEPNHLLRRLCLDALTLFSV